MNDNLVPTDPITLEFTGADHKALADALASAFPLPEALDEMLTARLNQPLANIAAPYPLGHATFTVVRTFKARGHLLRLIASARASQPDNPALAAVAERFALATATPPRAQLDRLEKIVKMSSQPFAVAVWRQRLERRETCVCRVEVPTAAGVTYGTGFLVSPGRVLTNYHVVAAAIPGFNGARADPSRIVLRFDYKELLDKTTVNPGVEVKLAQNWLVDSSPYSRADLETPPRKQLPTLDELDYALLELAEPVGSQPIPLGPSTDSRSMNRGWIELRSTPWPFAENPALLILQHPNGAPLSLAMDLDGKIQENENQTRITYQTGTQPGSSGSPCFNQYWDLVALHHAGDPLYPELDPKAFNEGIPIHRIVERLTRLNLTQGMTLSS